MSPEALRTRLRALPRWARLAVGSGVVAVVVGTAVTLVHRAFGDPWGDAALSGLLYGVLYGAVQVPLTSWLSGRTEAYRSADRATRKAAEKAVVRGAPPADPQVRALAHTILVDRLPRVERLHRIVVVVLLGTAAVATVLAVVRDPVAWVAVALLLAVTAVFPLLLRRLRRRADLLAPPS